MYISLALLTILLVIAFISNMALIKHIRDIYPIPVLQITLIIVKSTIISTAIIYEWMRVESYAGILPLLKYSIDTLTLFALVFVAESKLTLRLLVMLAISLTFVGVFCGGVTEEEQRYMVIGVSVLVFLTGLRKQVSGFGGKTMRLAAVILVMFSVSQHVVAINKSQFFSFLNVYIIVLGLMFIEPTRVVDGDGKHVELVEEPSGSFQASNYNVN